MRHKEGEVINVRDCALLRSGPKDNDVPFVAKISALYEDHTTSNYAINIIQHYFSIIRIIILIIISII